MRIALINVTARPFFGRLEAVDHSFSDSRSPLENRSNHILFTFAAGSGDLCSSPLRDLYVRRTSRRTPYAAKSSQKN